jgi:hypothetical protein
LALGCVLPGLLFQDCCRYLYFAERSGARATALDAIWAIALFPAAAVAIHLDINSAAGFIIVWGAAAAIAGSVGAYWLRLRPKAKAAGGWWVAQRDLVPRFAVESLLLNGTGQGASYALAAIAGLGGVAAVRGAGVLLGPVNILFMGIGVVAVSEGSRLVQTRPASARRAAALLGGGLAATALLFATVAFELPSRVGERFLGESWASAHAVVLVLGFSMAANGVAIGAGTGLRWYAAAGRSLRARVFAAPMVLLGGATGAAFGDAQGACIGMAAANLLGALIWWRQFYVTSETEMRSARTLGLVELPGKA